jgi:hypothetical protein
LEENTDNPFIIHMETPILRSAALAFACGLLSTTMAIAQDIKPFQAEAVKPSGNREVKAIAERQTAPAAKREAVNLVGLYQYWVPGTSYTVSDYTNDKQVIRTSAGSGVLPGNLKINPNGTYIWNSSWDGKIIKGNWKLIRDPDYQLELINAQEGKNWKVGKSNDQGIAILIWNGSTWYNGKKIKQ